jgi:hypothetical protein
MLMWRNLVGKKPVQRGRSKRQLAWWTLAGLALAYTAWKLSKLARGLDEAEDEWRGDGEPKQ